MIAHVPMYLINELFPSIKCFKKEVLKYPILNHTVLKRMASLLTYYVTKMCFDFYFKNQKNKMLRVLKKKRKEVGGLGL